MESVKVCPSSPMEACPSVTLSPPVPPGPVAFPLTFCLTTDKYVIV